MFALVLFLAAQAPLPGTRCPDLPRTTPACNVPAIKQRNINQQIKQLEDEISAARPLLSQANENITNKREAVSQLAIWQKSLNNSHVGKETLESENASMSKMLADKIAQKKKENLDLVKQIKELEKKLQKADSEWQKLIEEKSMRNTLYNLNLKKFERFLDTSKNEVLAWTGLVTRYSTESTDLQKELQAVDENLKTSLNALAQSSLTGDSEHGILANAKSIRSQVTEKLLDLVNQ